MHEMFAQVDQKKPNIFEGVDDTQPTPVAPKLPATTKPKSVQPPVKNEQIFEGVVDKKPESDIKPAGELDRYETMTYAEAAAEGRRNFKGNWWRAIRDLGAVVSNPKSLGVIGKLISELMSVPITPGQRAKSPETPVLDALVDMYVEAYGGHSRIKRQIATNPVDTLSDLMTFVPMVGMAGKALKVPQLLSKTPKLAKGVRIGLRAGEVVVDPAGAVGALAGDAIQKGIRRLPRHKLTEYTQIDKQNKIIDELSKQYTSNASSKRVGELLTKSFRKYSRDQTKNLTSIIRNLKKTHNLKLKGDFAITDSILSSMRTRSKTQQVPNKTIDNFVNTTRGVTTGSRAIDSMLFSFDNMIEYISENPDVHRYVDVDEVLDAMKNDIVDTIQYNISSKIKSDIDKLSQPQPMLLDNEISELPDLISALTGVDMNAQDITDLLSGIGVRPRDGRVQGDMADIVGEIVAAKYADNFKKALDEMHSFKNSAIQNLFRRNAKTPEKIVPFILKDQSVDSRQLSELKFLSQMSDENSLIFQAAILHELFTMTPAQWKPDGLMNAIDTIGIDRLEILLESDAMRKLTHIAEESLKLKSFQDLAQRFNISTYLASGATLGGGAAIAWSSGQWKWLLGSVLGAGILQILRMHPNRTNYIIRTPVKWSGTARQVGREASKTSTTRPKRAARNLKPTDKLRFNRYIVE